MKRLSFCIILILLIIAASGAPQAKVTGECYNCHTMHNSQGGSSMAYDFNETSFTETDTPKDCLLIYSCLGCHSATDDATWQDAITKAPIVFNTSAPTYGANGLAGGNFYYVSGTVDDTGHNVLSNTDGTLTAPPGDENTTGITTVLTCAGTKGCHGDRAISGSLAAIKSAHHANAGEQLTTASTVANSYRFLKGVQGYEDSDWQATTSVGAIPDHNEYKAGTLGGTESGIATPAGASISGLCGECHGNFHGSADTQASSPFLRHPVDLVIPASGEYASMSTTYNLTVPVGRTTVPDAPSAAVAAGTDAVICLSCHRAHASPNSKMMRWDYKSATVSTAISGCNVCHTSKN